MTRKLASLALFAASAAFAQNCNRACLEAHVDRYLQAMVAHDPGKLKLSGDFKFTENDVSLKPGEALWRTATGVGRYKLYFVDVPAQQVAYYGTMLENGRGIAIALRLKIDGDRLAEAEQLVLRTQRTFDLMEQASTPDPILLETVPVPNRVTRAELIRNANLYFEAIEQGNGKVAPFAPDCNRFENGFKTSGDTGCSDQLDTQVFNYIQKIYPRRFLVIDEERQVVFGFFMFNHPGDITWVNTPGQGRRELTGAAKRAFSVEVAEAFAIRNNQIRKVEALMTSLPYGTRSPFVPTAR
jgi:hypothetical protein